MQKLIQGEGSINEIAGELASRGYDSVFLITGKHFDMESNQGFLQQFNVSHFIKSGINVEEEEAERAFERYSQNTTQVIIAIGGGSVIDVAKYIIYRLTTFSLPVPFFIAAPTTGGSGSEATHFAVIYKKKKKISLSHPSLLPQLVVLDPQLTYSLTAYQTAVSGMDVLAQSVESYWNVNANNQSKEYATESILLWKSFYSSSVEKADKVSRQGMQQAAYLAGKAINITRTTGPHALSYYLTANHNVPHGQAVALFLPLFFMYNQPQKNLCKLLDVEDEGGAIKMIQQKMQQAGLATRLNELGIEKENIIEYLLNDVNEERFANNPEKFDRQKLKQLIHHYL
jgi:alcohol dehydrogenase